MWIVAAILLISTFFVEDGVFTFVDLEPGEYRVTVDPLLSSVHMGSSQTQAFVPQVAADSDSGNMLIAYSRAISPNASSATRSTCRSTR